MNSSSDIYFYFEYLHFSQCQKLWNVIFEIWHIISELYWETLFPSPVTVVSKDKVFLTIFWKVWMIFLQFFLCWYFSVPFWHSFFMFSFCLCSEQSVDNHFSLFQSIFHIWMRTLNCQDSLILSSVTSSILMSPPCRNWCCSLSITLL